MSSNEEVVSHALVRLIQSKINEVIDVCLIKQFKKGKPDDKTDFVKGSVYHGKVNPTDPYVAIEILALGNESEMQELKDNGTKRLKFHKFNFSDYMDDVIENSSSDVDATEKSDLILSDSESDKNKDSIDSEETVFQMQENKNKINDKLLKDKIQKHVKKQEKHILIERQNLLKNTSQLSFHDESTILDGITAGSVEQHQNLSTTKDIVKEQENILENSNELTTSGSVEQHQNLSTIKDIVKEQENILENSNELSSDNEPDVLNGSKTSNDASGGLKTATDEAQVSADAEQLLKQQLLKFQELQKENEMLRAIVDSTKSILLFNKMEIPIPIKSRKQLFQHSKTRSDDLEIRTLESAVPVNNDKENQVSNFSGKLDEQSHNKEIKKKVPVKPKSVIKKTSPASNSTVEMENAISPEDSYSEDESDGQPKMDILQSWYKKVDNKKIHMVHLGNNISIRNVVWHNIKKSEKPSIFVKNIARSIWGSDKLANRCLKEVDILQKVSDRESPRKVLTPKKVGAIKHCLRYWMIKYKSEKFSRTEVEEQVNKIRSYLTEEIAYQVKQIKQQKKSSGAKPDAEPTDQ